VPLRVLDLRHRENPNDRAGFDRVRRAERHYGVQLRKIAREVGRIIDAYPPGDPAAEPLIRQILRRYAEILTPWARTTAKSMLVDVSRRDEKVWQKLTENMGAAMRLELRGTRMEPVLAQLEAEQVELIRSIPLDAAQRVHKLTIEGLSDATRASEIAAEIRRSTHVSESKANLIARTEVGRAAASITQARAVHVESDGYIWRTAGDSAVRDRHRKLAGKFFKWDEPPVTGENGERSLPGAIYNCRCYPEVVLPEVYRGH
jgi:SPP1 gp7 family putative phage head morphogenesis protein